MQQILIYADSLSWGIIPMTRSRFEFNQRWPGVMEQQLLSLGKTVLVIEDCLNGRRTMYEDAPMPSILVVAAPTIREPKAVMSDLLLTTKV